MSTEDSLTPEDRIRYSRQMILPEIGVEGQLALRRARVLIVGAGGLGSPAALYLAAAGVGQIGLADFDRVDLSNLQRQILHDASTIGQPKAESGARRLRELNPGVEIHALPERLHSMNALQILAQYDLAIDGSDNFPTRYLLNDACVMQKKPMIFGAISRFEGQASVLAAPGGPCYRCLHPEPPAAGDAPNCAEEGALGAVPGVIGAIQAAECVKWIVGRGDCLIGRLLLFDAFAARFREIRVRRDPGCAVCGDHPTIRRLMDYEDFCGALADDDADATPRIAAADAKARIDRGDALRLLDVRSPEEVAVYEIPGALRIPLEELTRRLPEIRPLAPEAIAVICRDRIRSRQACEILREAGAVGVCVVEGGINAWMRLGA